MWTDRGMMPVMHLTTKDTEFLRSRLAAVHRIDRVWKITIAADVVAAVAIFFVLEPPINYLLAVAMVVSGVVVMYVMRLVVGRMGDPKPILDGAEPTAWTEVVALGAEGAPPRSWSFEVTGEPGKYLHTGEPGVPGLSFETGQTYRVFGFGTSADPYNGIVYLEPTHHNERYWCHNALLSDERWNTATSN